MDTYLLTGGIALFLAVLVVGGYFADRWEGRSEGHVRRQAHPVTDSPAGRRLDLARRWFGDHAGSQGRTSSLRRVAGRAFPPAERG